MKFAENANIEEYQKALSVGAAKGAALGLGIGGAFGAYLKKRTNFFSGRVGGYQRVFIFVAPAAFCTIVNMELSSRDFEAQQRERQHGENLGVTSHAPNRNASIYDKFMDFMGANKYKVIVGGWAASMAGSFYLVNRDKYITKSQKIVQARVYAQGLTVAMLLASVVLSVNDTQNDQQKATSQSQSWERDIKFVETANHPHGKYSSAAQRRQAEEAEVAFQAKELNLSENSKNVESARANMEETVEKPKAEKQAEKQAEQPKSEQPKSEKPEKTESESKAEK